MTVPVPAAAALASAAARRPNLLFVRAGDQSLHPRLIAEDPQRNWDCCVSWYIAPRSEQPAVQRLCAGAHEHQVGARHG